MHSHLYWDQFADISVNRLVNPGKGESFLIIADPKNDLNLAETLLSAGLRSGADTQLIIKRLVCEEGTVSAAGSHPFQCHIEQQVCALALRWHCA